MEKKKSTTKKSFESSLRELEEIAVKLESGELDLDDSIKEFEKGIKFAKYCNEKLEEAEQKIEILQKSGSEKTGGKSISVDAETGEIDDNEDLQGTLL